MKMQETMDVAEDYIGKVDEKIETLRDGIKSEMNKAFENSSDKNVK